MANTGYKIVLTLKELNGTLPTGNTKPNVVGDPDYEPKYFSPDCPVTYDLTCPVGMLATPHSGSIEFECSIPNSVVNNPLVLQVVVKCMNTTLEAGSKSYVLPHTPHNYFHDTFTGLSSTIIYRLRVDYLGAGGAIVHTCSFFTDLQPLP